MTHDSVLLSKLKPGLVCANRELSRVVVSRSVSCGWFAVTDHRGVEYYVDANGRHRHNKKLDLVADYDLRMHVPSVYLSSGGARPKTSKANTAQELFVED